MVTIWGNQTAALDFFWMRDIISVLDAEFNAPADGSDALDSIQRAVNAAGGGRALHIPKGLVFTLYSTLKLPDDIVIFGGGELKLADGADVHLIENVNYASGTNHDIVIDGIILNGNQANQSAYSGTYDTHIVHLKGVTGLYVRGCEIKNAGIDCVNLVDCDRPEFVYNHMWGSRNHAVTFQNTPGLRGVCNRIHHCGSNTDAYGITSSGHAFIGVNVACDNVVLTNNIIYDMGDSCLRNERAGSGWIISNNLVIRSGKDAIKIMGYAGLDAAPVANIVSGNIVIDAGNDGIFATGKCLVSGNYVFGSGKNVAGAAVGKWFTSASCIKTFFNSVTQTYRPKVTGNFCTDGLYAGIYVGAVNDAEVTDNTCWLNGIAGIAVIDCARGVIVKRNTCMDNGTASVGTGFGIRFSLFGVPLQEDGSLTDNDCGNTTTANQGYGIYLSGTETRDCIIKYNNLRNNVVAPYLDASGTSTNNLVAYNEGYITESKGTAVIPSGSTSILVNHGCSKTPTASQVSVTPTNLLGLAGKFALGTISATQLQILVDVDPGAATATFTWQVA